MEDRDFIGEGILESPEVELTQRLLGMGFKGELSEMESEKISWGHNRRQPSPAGVVLCSSNCAAHGSLLGARRPALGFLAVIWGNDGWDS